MRGVGTQQQQQLQLSAVCLVMMVRRWCKRTRILTSYNVYKGFVYFLFSSFSSSGYFSSSSSSDPPPPLAAWGIQSALVLITPAVCYYSFNTHTHPPDSPKKSRKLKNQIFLNRETCGLESEAYRLVVSESPRWVFGTSWLNRDRRCDRWWQIETSCDFLPFFTYVVQDYTTPPETCPP